ncbi:MULTISPECIES: RHS repeat-associated core domain-containing protein [Pseudomonas fluorescens group]
MAALAPTQQFYCKSRLTTEIEGALNRSIVQHHEQLLALAETKDNVRRATLVATDQQRSVLQAIASNESQSFAYSPYGHRPAGGGLLSLLGFNGERLAPVTGHYLLGNGYRAFSPVLLRFNRPDRLSPFGAGGVNAYAYCVGDPINRSDPNGTAGFFTWIRNFFSKARCCTTPRAGQRIATERSFMERLARANSHNLIQPPTPTITRVVNSDNQTVRTFKAPTLKQLAFSKLTKFDNPEFIALRNQQEASILQHSKINLYNQVEGSFKAAQLYPNPTLTDFKRTNIFNGALLKAQSGYTPGVDPFSIRNISMEKLPPLAEYEEFDHSSRIRATP